MSALTQLSAFIDERGHTLSAKGFIRVEFSSEIDLFKLAASQGLNVYLDVRTCGGDVKLSYWHQPFPAGDREYVALIDVKGYGKNPYDLIREPQDICLAVKFGSMNPLQNARSRPLRVAVPEDVRQSLDSFHRDGGKSEIFYQCPAPQCRAESAQE